jgi:selenophosphate synthase
LADAQTSGGLLLASDGPDALVDALRAGAIDAWHIGAVVDRPPGRIDVSGRLAAD